MDPKSSYPDPETAHGGMHPFSYAAQPPMPPAEHAQTHMQQAPAANMRGGSISDGQEYGQSHHNGQAFAQDGHFPREAQPSTPQQLAQRGLDADRHRSHEHNNADSSARKRAKVTRACDECRRKKVACSQSTEARPPTLVCTLLMPLDTMRCRVRNTWYTVRCLQTIRPGMRLQKSTTKARSKQRVSRSLRNAGLGAIYSFSCSYIKELAERVNRLENSGATPPDVQYAPVNHDPSSVGSVYAPPLDYTRHRHHGMMVGPQVFEPDHQDLHGFSAGHRNADTTAAQGLQGARVSHPSSHIHHQPPDVLNIMAPDPSTDK